MTELLYCPAFAIDATSHYILVDEIRESLPCDFVFHSCFFSLFSAPISFPTCDLPYLPLLILHCLSQDGMSVGCLGMGSCNRRCLTAAPTQGVFLPCIPLLPGLWCAACTMCQHTRSDSTSEINGSFWLERISWCDSSHSYNNGYVGPRQYVWCGWGKKCIFKYNDSSLERQDTHFSFCRLYQGGQQQNCAAPWGDSLFFQGSLNEGPDLHVSASP